MSNLDDNSSLKPEQKLPSAKFMISLLILAIITYCFMVYIVLPNEQLSDLVVQIGLVCSVPALSGTALLMIHRYKANKL